MLFNVPSVASMVPELKQIFNSCEFMNTKKVQGRIPALQELSLPKERKKEKKKLQETPNYAQ